MIGIVTDQYRAILHLIVHCPDGQEQEVEVVLDTGFDGHLTLSPATITSLGLNYSGESMTTLADGQDVKLPLYEAVVLWNGQERSVYVVATEGAVLPGMLLLAGSRVTFDVIDGGSVIIEDVP